MSDVTDNDPQANLSAIMSRKVSQRCADAAEVLTERAQYTATALEALAQFHERNDDAAGAALLREFRETFAKHEASNL